MTQAARRAVVLGIDPGTTGMGYAFLDTAVDPARVLASGLVASLREGTNAERLLVIATALDALIGEHGPEAVAIERLYFNKNVKTAMLVAEARGVALLCAARAGLRVVEYTPQEVKLSVTGNGGADKRSVQHMIGVLLALEEPITQDNVADAVAIALTHAQRARYERAISLAR